MSSTSSKRVKTNENENLPENDNIHMKRDIAKIQLNETLQPTTNEHVLQPIQEQTLQPQQQQFHQVQQQQYYQWPLQQPYYNQQQLYYQQPQQQYMPQIQLTTNQQLSESSYNLKEQIQLAETIQKDTEKNETNSADVTLEGSPPLNLLNKSETE